MPYRLHPSERLVSLFREKPWQGCHPADAQFLLVGLDANYAEDIELSPIFSHLLEYLADGPAFWRRHGVHHPFMLPEYRGDGRRYHKTFASIGFKPEDSAVVSFVELLHLPTYGRSKLLAKDLDHDHLKRLNDAILKGRAEFIFLPSAVGRLMNASGHFPWLPKRPSAGNGPLKIWYGTEHKTVYWHYHFSVYGAFEKEKQRQLAAIAELARS